MPASTLLALPALVAPAPQGPMEVRVDLRFELMSIVFRLASFREYRMGSIADYNAAVDGHFGPFEGHPAVQMARTLRHRLGYDAIPRLAILAKDAEGFEPLLEGESFDRALDPRWKPADARCFLRLMRDFAKDTKAQAFFQAQEPFYGKLARACREGLVGALDQAWFARTFGPQPDTTFTLCVAPLNGGGNYGPSVPNDKGGRDLYAFLGTAEAGPGQVPGYDTRNLWTLVHEFLHSFANPWVDRHERALTRAGEALLGPVKEQMRSQAYGDGNTILKESLVRAFTVRYFQDHGDARGAERALRSEAQLGFYWVAPLVDVLDAYQSQRDQYPQLEAFTPKLVAAFAQWGSQAKSMASASAAAEAERQERTFADGPNVLEMVPADGSKDLDPATKVLRIRFDRPMRRSVALLRAGLAFPEVQGVAEWDAEARTVTFSMRLQPGTTYAFWLNGMQALGFRDAQDRPLRPRKMTFTTR